MTDCKGYIDSIYSGSCVDGSGIRAVIFMSGCNLRCPFCHNPETLFLSGKEVTVKELTNKILRFANYLSGGVTLSGGEPFLQADFSLALIESLEKENVSVVIETNGSIVDERLISRAEYCIVDVKNQYQDGASAVGQFLDVADRLGKNVELTCVFIKGINDSTEKIDDLIGLFSHPSVRNIRPLPFSKLCVEKYKKIGIPFGYAEKDEFSAEEFDTIRNTISNKILRN